ncbi:MAG: type II toxin-antitoxin system prevent-host-death family antitoxin [Pseudomonadota bacterium]
MSETVSVHEAKTHLSRLINDVLAGKEVIVSRRNEPVIRLMPYAKAKPKKRVLGRLAHLVPEGVDDILAHGFWDPLTDEEMGLGDDEDWFADRK